MVDLDRRMRRGESGQWCKVEERKEEGDEEEKRTGGGEERVFICRQQEEKGTSTSHQARGRGRERQFWAGSEAKSGRGGVQRIAQKSLGLSNLVTREDSLPKGEPSFPFSVGGVRVYRWRYSHCQSQSHCIYTTVCSVRVYNPLEGGPATNTATCLFFLD